MGFLQVVKGEEMAEEKLTRYWGESRSSRIENGGKVIVRENEILLQIKNHTVIDVVIGAGGYVYHSDIEANQDTLAKAYAEVYNEILAKNNDYFGEDEIKIIGFEPALVSPDELRRQFESYSDNKSQNNIRDTSNESWICKCGVENRSNFCKKCGTPRPQEPENTPVSAPEPTPQTSSEASPAKNTDGTWICEKCGIKNQFAFCKNCGTPRPQESENTPVFAPEPIPQTSSEASPEKNTDGTWICEKCGMDLKSYQNDKYCPKCGNYIRKV